MDLHQRTLRIGLMMILCALVFRLCSTDVSQVLPFLRQLLHPISMSINTETGQEVRFSSSTSRYSPQFMESPPPWDTPADTDAVPVFSGTEDVEVTNMASVQPDIGQLLSQPLTWNLRQEEPTVLILHTHTTESYTKGSQNYVETAAYRTLDEAYNMLSIGALTAQLLNQQGIPTIQDRQLHDYPSYNGSYTDARKSIRAYLEAYPSIQLILDLHRDATEEGSGQQGTVVQTQRGTSAQLMVVIGANHSGYAENLSLGLKLQAQLEGQCAGITRPLQLRGSRFNQDLCPGALLVEVGAAGNTQDEALAAARQLSLAVAALAQGTQAPESGSE